MQLLKNKVCLITGTNRGIGAGLLEAFARESAIIFANARTPGCIDQIALRFQNRYGAKIEPVYFDVRDTAEIKKTIIKIQKEHGRLDVLVNNAGVMKDALIGMASKELMRETFETNVYASMELLQYAARVMMKNKSGSIINFASIVGLRGNKGQLVYAASKSAVIGMTMSAAKELAPYNIRVNAVAPGMIDTDMFRSIGENRVSEMTKQIGAGRLGTPSDVADVCIMLASDYTRYVTGQTIGVDGGGSDIAI